MMAQFQAQLNDASTRMLRAVEEHNLALKQAARKSEDLVDSKGVGQLFKFSGKTDKGFSEWSHKFKTFAKAKYGNEIDKVLSWAVRQKKVIVKDKTPFGDSQVAWNTEFGDAADLDEQIDNVDVMVSGLLAYLELHDRGGRQGGSQCRQRWH